MSVKMNTIYLITAVDYYRSPIYYAGRQSITPPPPPPPRAANGAPNGANGEPNTAAS
jgi:hypothetical protein